jgi:hypothetical protein
MIDAPFQLIDPASASPNGVGPWGAVAAVEELSFAADSAVAVPIWRATLPDDAVAAAAQLQAAEAMLHADRVALANTPQRLATLRQSQAAGPSFSGAGNEAPPEQGVLALLNAAELRANSVSFSSAEADAVPEEARGAFAQIQALSAQVLETVSNFALVETVQAGRTLGRTRVSWTGHVGTVLAVGTLPEQAILHRRTLRLALQSRLTLLQTFATVTRGAGIVVTMASSPAGALVALPAAWRFVKDLFQESRADHHT